MNNPVPGALAAPQLKHFLKFLLAQNNCPYLPVTKLRAQTFFSSLVSWKIVLGKI